MEHVGQTFPILCAFLSSSANSSSASLSIFWICSSVKRPLSLVMVIFSFLPVALSSAATLTIPSLSTSNVTSICGWPRGAGGMPVRSKRPNKWLSLVKWTLHLHRTWDIHTWLVVLSGRKDLRLLGRNDCVASDKLGHDTTHRLDAKGQRCCIQDQHTISFSAQNTSLKQQHHKLLTHQDWYLDLVLCHWRNLSITFAPLEYVWSHPPTQSHQPAASSDPHPPRLSSLDLRSAWRDRHSTPQSEHD